MEKKNQHPLEERLIAPFELLMPLVQRIVEYYEQIMTGGNSGKLNDRTYSLYVGHYKEMAFLMCEVVAKDPTEQNIKRFNELRESLIKNFYPRVPHESGRCSGSSLGLERCILTLFFFRKATRYKKGTKRKNYPRRSTSLGSSLLTNGQFTFQKR